MEIRNKVLANIKYTITVCTGHIKKFRIKILLKENIYKYMVYVHYGFEWFFWCNIQYVVLSRKKYDNH